MNNLSEIKEESVKKILNITMDAKEKEEFESLIEELLNELNEEIVLSSSNNILSDKIKSEELNKISKNLFLDLFIAFENDKNISKEIQKINLKSENNKNMLVENVRKLKEMNDITNSRNTFLSNKIINTFNIFTKQEKENILSTSYDEVGNFITLPIETEENHLVTSSGNINAVITEEQLTGNQLSYSNNLNYIIDYSKETYFLKEIYTNEAIRIQLDGFNSNTQGIISTFTLSFDSIKEINQLVLEPFCEYPMDILSIKIKNVYTAVFEEILIDSLLLENNSVINFYSRFTDEIKITIQQQNFVKKKFQFNKKDLIKEKLDSLSLDKKEYKKALKKLKLDNLTRIKEIFSSDEIIETIKNKYAYGFRHIAAYKKVYKEQGVFLSEEYKNDKDYDYLELEVDIEEGTFNEKVVTDQNFKLISVEDNMEYDILPKNITEIKCEKLSPSNNKTFKTRFPIKEIIKIFENDIKLNHTDFEIINDNLILINASNNFFNYTIHYKPKYTPFGYKVIDKIISIKGDNKNSYPITETISEETIINSVKILNVKTNVFDIISNIEDATDEDGNALNVDTSQGIICFANVIGSYFLIRDNNIIFNKPITLEEEIEMNIINKMNRFQLKIEMNRNIEKSNSITNKVNSYEIHVKKGAF